MGNEEDARILALEQELAGSDTGSNDDKAAKAARKAAKAARKEAKAARKEAAAGSSDAAAAGSADAAAAGSADAAAAGSADAAAVTAPVITARMFSVHAGETVHFSGRKPGDPKPKRGAKKRAREAAEDAPAPPPRWRCELCSIEVNSQDLLEEHREGWRHAEMVASKAARAAGLYCEVRRATQSFKRAGTHCSLAARWPRPRPLIGIDGARRAAAHAHACPPLPLPAAQVCSQGFTGQEQMDEHLNGGRHAAAVRGGGKGGKGKGGKDGKDSKGGKGGKDGKGGKGGKDGKGGKGGKGAKGANGDGKGGDKGATVRQWC